MRNDSTRKIESREAAATNFEEWLQNRKATLVVMSGPASGSEYIVETPSISIGRGEAAGWCFADDSMSGEHAALEFSGGGMRLRDLGSMNGCRVNGAPVHAADLKNGDRVELGESAFLFVLEERRRAPRTYVIDPD